MRKLSEIDINKTEEEIMKFAQEIPMMSPSSEIRQMYMDYTTSLLLAKQQQRFNIDLLKVNKHLAVATWILVIISLVSNIFSIHYQKYQTIPIANSLAKDVNEKLSICFQNSDSNLTMLDGSIITCKKFLNQHKPQLDSQLNLFPLLNSTSTWLVFTKQK